MSKIDEEDSRKIKELVDLSKEYENDPGLMNLKPEDCRPGPHDEINAKRETLGSSNY